MNKIKVGKHEFEIVESFPKDYEIWNIGKNMIDGYLPLCQVGGYNNWMVNVDTLKAIKLDNAQTILAAVGRGQKTIKEMENYIKRYSNSKNECTLYHIEKLKKALEVMYTIKFD